MKPYQKIHGLEISDKLQIGGLNVGQQTLILIQKQ